MKKIALTLLLIIATSTFLHAKDFYIQVVSLYNQKNLFNVSYRLNELGYNMNVSQKDNLYRVYTGPFKDKYSAYSALREIRKNSK